MSLLNETHEHSHISPAGEVHSEEAEWEHQQPLIIFFVFFGLFFGGILRQVNQATKIPYTPMLIVLGIFLSEYTDELGFIGDSIKIWSRINPHMILFIFIPVLIFESGFNCDWYVFRRALVNIILLAAPGVFIGAILLGVFLKVVLSYDDISWYGALTMGSILCATDPVAVVALLKELGASVQFNTLIEGESLLNDGTAMVFYQVFVNLEKGKSSSPIDVVLGFCRTSLGGPVLGVVMGIVGSYWLRRIIRDDVLTSVVTFIVCYICFYLAEFSFLAVSGILSIVVLGLFMSANGKTKIYPESEHAVHTVWAFVQYSCETLIFLLTGILIGVEIVGQSTIVTSDWFKLFIFWCFMVVARYLMIIILMPLLKKSGYPISPEELWVLVWGGLRGALGLTLSLMVLVDEELESVRLKQLTVFYMAGAATLTLLINGTTCGTLVTYLKIVEVTAVKKRLLENSMRNMINDCNDKLKSLKRNQFLQFADWNKVEKISGLDELKTEMYRSEQGVNISQRKSTYAGFNKQEILVEIRFRLLRSLKGLFWENYEQGQLSANAVKLLDEAMSRALEHTSSPLKLWDLIYINFTNLQYLQIMFTINNWVILGSIAKQYITNHLSFVYEVVSTFIMCTHEIEEIQSQLPLSKAYVNEVSEELQLNSKQAEHYLAELQDNFPQIIKSIHTKRAANGIIEAQKHFVQDYKNKGYIDDTDYIAFRKRIDAKAVELENMTFDWVLPTFQSILLEFPIFNSLTQEQLKTLQQNQKVKTFEPGEEIYVKGQPFRNIYIITSGTVDENITQEFSHTLGIGGFLSFAHCVSESDEVSASTAVAITKVKTNYIPFSVIKQIMKSNRTFEQKMYMKSMIYFVRINPEFAGPLKSLNEINLNEYCENAEFFSLAATQNINFEHGGYLIAGTLKESTNGNTHKQFCYIQPSSGQFTAQEDVYVIKFINDISKKITVMDSAAEEAGYLKYKAENHKSSPEKGKNQSDVIELQQI